MTSDQDLVVETVRDILSGTDEAGLWTALAEAGLTGVGLPEEAGGSGGELADAVAVVRTLAAGAAAVPVAEQLLVAAPALLAAGLPLPSPDEPTTFADAVGVTATESGPGRFALTGTATDVAWAGVAARVVLLATTGNGSPVLALVDAPATAVRPNLAGEPRGSLVLEGVDAPGTVMTSEQVEAVRARFALARAVQMSAALEQTLAWTVQYAGERQQFGRPLGAFQAIQMQLAEMAGAVASAAAATDAAVQALEREAAQFGPAAAAAKTCAGSAIEVVARLAHQVHGAIGFTEEHRLHHLTRRLWAWRDEAGSELAWSRALGTHLADDENGLWTALTRLG